MTASPGSLLSEDLEVCSELLDFGVEDQAGHLGVCNV